MAELPTGTVTFLFTDVEGSTALGEQYPEAMSRALVRHDTLVELHVAEHGGVVVRPRGEGDSHFAVFSRASDAVSAAAVLQQATYAEPWPTPKPLRVRMAVHTGEPDLRDGGYYGSPVNRCARLRAVAHGGQLLISLATEQVVRGNLPPVVTLRDLGTHRLRDLQQPERIYQLVADGLPADFPPIITLDARPHNLPLQPTLFIGREGEVAALCRQMLDPQVRLITMTGPGGTGKTRLALHAAADVLDHFADGVWLVELAPMHDPVQVLVAIGAVFGIGDSGGQPLIERLASFLHHKQLLLVLDNFEQVLAAARDVAHLLASAAGLKVLVTSRAVLHLSAEHTFPVPPLGLPDRSQSSELAVLLQSDAVMLFLQRAQAVKPEFALTEANAPIVADICARLDGLPLALELAAARIRLFTPQALLSRLRAERASLQLLTGGARDLPVRQQTIRNTIAWSYGLLSDAEQRIFRRLAVFIGGWTLEAAEMVCDIDGDLGLDVLEGLTVLLEQGLVRQVAGLEGESRFRRLETIREYAVGQLSTSGEGDRMRQRHADYYVTLAETAEHGLRSAQQVTWLQHLDVELDNFRAALTHLLEHGDTYEPERCEQAMRIVAALWKFWLIRGYYEEWQRWLARAMECSSFGPEASGDARVTQARAQALFGRGVLAVCEGDGACAIAVSEESLALFQVTGDTWGIAAAQINLGMGELSRDLTDAGHAHLTEGLSLARTVGDAWLLAWSLFNYGLTVWNQDDRARAATLYEEGLVFARATGDGWLLAWGLHYLGAPSIVQRDVLQAAVLLEGGLAIRRALGDKLGVAHSLGGLAVLAMTRGDYAAARTLNSERLRTEQELGNAQGVAASEELQGEIALAQGDYVQAAECHRTSLALVQALGDQSKVARAFHNLGRVALAQGDYQQAKTVLAESVAIRRTIGDKLGITWSLSVLGQVAQATHDYGWLRMLQEERLMIDQELGNTEDSAWALYRLGQGALAIGDDSYANAHFKESLTLFQGLGVLSGMTLCLWGLAMLAAAQDQWMRAVQLGGAAIAHRQRMEPVTSAREQDFPSEALVATGWTTIQFRRSADGEQDFPSDALLATARNEYGEARVAEAWQKGQAMPIAQAIGFALEPGM